MTILYYTLFTLLILSALLLIGLILIQKGRGGGLSSAFGGGGGSAAFGAKTGDVLTWATSAFFGFFIVLAVVLDLVVQHNYPSAPTVTASNTPAITTPAPAPPESGRTEPPMTTPTTNAFHEIERPLTTQQLIGPMQPVLGRPTPAPPMPVTVPTSVPTTRP